MTFKEKCALIDVALVQYPTFRREFNDYLAFGHSTNGAYHHFSLEDIERHKLLSQKEAELVAWQTKHGSVQESSPMRLSSHSIIGELEELDGKLSNS